MNDKLLALIQENIATNVRAVVNQMTCHLTAEEDEKIRRHLTDTFRFWRPL